MVLSEGTWADTPANSRLAGVFAWPIVALTAALTGGTLGLAALNGTSPWDLQMLPVVASCAAVGGIVASRRPAHPVGWLLLVSGLCIVVLGFAPEYVRYGALPGAAVLDELYAVLVVPGLAALVIFLPLVFPDGQLPSSRWRSVLWVAAGFVLLASGYAAVRPGEIRNAAGMVNPLGLEVLQAVVPILDGVALAFWVGLPIAAASSQVVRIPARVRRAATAAQVARVRPHDDDGVAGADVSGRGN